MAETGLDIDRTIPKQVNDTDGSSGNGASIGSSSSSGSRSNSLSLRLISDRFPTYDGATDDTHISTDQHRYYIQEMSAQDLNSNYQDEPRGSDIHEGREGVAHSVRDPPCTSPFPLLHDWLESLNHSQAHGHPGETHIGRGNGSSGISEASSRREHKTNRFPCYSSAGQIHNIVTSQQNDKNILGIACLILVVLVFGVGNVMPRLYHIEDQIIQTNIAVLKMHDAIKQLETGQGHGIMMNQPDYLNHFQQGINTLLSWLWSVLLIIFILVVNAVIQQNDLQLPSNQYMYNQFVRLEDELHDLTMQESYFEDTISMLVNDLSVKDAQLVKLYERLDKLDHDHDHVSAHITSLNSTVRNHLTESDIHNRLMSEFVSGLQDNIESLGCTVDNHLMVSGDPCGTFEYQNQQNLHQTHDEIPELDSEKIRLRTMPPQETLKQHNKSQAEMAEEISVQSSNMEQNDIDMYETVFLEETNSVRHEIHTKIDSLMNFTTDGQSRVQTLKESTRTVQINMKQLKETINTYTVEQLMRTEENQAEINLLCNKLAG